jgi:GNAT superfamily N-acetyltransferase
MHKTEASGTPVADDEETRSNATRGHSRPPSGRVDPGVTFDLRQLAVEDLEPLERELPVWSSREYAKRLQAQLQGDLVMIVAWAADRPIGRAMILFPSHEEYSESAERERCAEIRDVEVVPSARRVGVGTAMIAKLEAVARGRGFARTGLSVGRDREYGAARDLYAKLGYRPAHGPFISGVVLDGDDGPMPVTGVLDYQVKALALTDH